MHSPKKSDADEKDEVSVQEYVQSIFQNAIARGRDILVIPLTLQLSCSVPQPPINPMQLGSSNVTQSETSAFNRKPRKSTGVSPKKTAKGNELQKALDNRAPKELGNAALNKRKREDKTFWSKEDLAKNPPGERKTNSPKPSRSEGKNDKIDNIDDFPETNIVCLGCKPENSESYVRKSTRLPNANKVNKMGAIMYN